MRTTLKWVLIVFGVACIGIALAHIFIGPKTIIGANTPNATLDGDMRFAMVLFFAYGVACVWAALDLDARAGAVRLLMLIFFVGGLVRLLTVAYVGWPNWFYQIMLVVELVCPPVIVLWLRSVTGRPSPSDATSSPTVPSPTVPSPTMPSPTIGLAEPDTAGPTQPI